MIVWETVRWDGKMWYWESGQPFESFLLRKVLTTVAQTLYGVPQADTQYRMRLGSRRFVGRHVQIGLSALSFVPAQFGDMSAERWWQADPLQGTLEALHDAVHELCHVLCYPEKEAATIDFSLQLLPPVPPQECADDAQAVVACQEDVEMVEYFYEQVREDDCRFHEECVTLANDEQAREFARTRLHECERVYRKVPYGDSAYIRVYVT